MEVVFFFFFFDEESIYSEFSRTVDKRMVEEVKSQLFERAAQTKVLELGEKQIYFEGIKGLWESPVE